MSKSRRLKDFLSSSYIEAANHLNSKTAKRKIVAYVESYDDIFFWRTVLSSFEDDTRYFEVMLPSHGKLERGKKAAIMNMLRGKVGEAMIACVDADYDYLIQGASPQSKEILENPYIFHTYAYAIENLQCYAPSLHDVCVAVTLNDHPIFDFKEYMALFSEAIFPLFVWNIWYYRSTHYSEFTMTDFNKVIELGGFSLMNPMAAIVNIRRKVDRKVRQLQSQNPGAKDSYQKVKASLKALGVTPETTYLYIQGHHLFDKVVVPIMYKVCDQLVKERENEIYRQSVHNAQLNNELSCYSKSLQEIGPMLKKNAGYYYAEPFLRIRKDVEVFLSREHIEKTEVEKEAEERREMLRTERKEDQRYG